MFININKGLFYKMNSLSIAKKNVNDEMKKHTKNHYIYFIVYLLSIISMISAVIIGFSLEEKGIYKHLFILPFLYGTFNLVFVSIYKRISLFKFLLLGLLFIRYFITPLLVYIDGFPINIYYLSFSYETIIKQTFIMSYEMFIMFFMIWIFERKFTTANSHKKDRYDLNDNKNFAKLNFVVYMIIIFTIGLFCIYPDLLKNYRFIFDAEPQNTMASNRETIQMSVPNGLRWIGYTLGEAVRYVIVQRILLYIYRKSRDNPRNIHVATSLFIICVNSLIATSRNMVGIIMTLVFFNQIVIVYPKAKRFLIKLMMIMSFFMVIIFSSYYLKISMSYKSFANLLESYVGSTYEVYQSLRSFELADYTIFEKLYILLKGDTLGFINVINTILSKLGNITSTTIYNSYLYGNRPAGGHIVPMVSQAYFYFGIFLSPIFSALSIVMMYKMEKKVNKATGNYITDMFLGIVFSIAPIMYNYSIVLLLTTTVALPIYVMSILNRFVINKVH